MARREPLRRSPSVPGDAAPLSALGDPAPGGSAPSSSRGGSAPSSCGGSALPIGGSAQECAIPPLALGGPSLFGSWSSDTDSLPDVAEAAEAAEAGTDTDAALPMSAARQRDATLLLVGLRGEPRSVVARVAREAAAAPDADELFARLEAAGLARLWRPPPPLAFRATPAAPPPTAATAAAWTVWLGRAGLAPGPAALAAAAGATSNIAAAARMAGAVLRAAADAHAAGEIEIRGVERLTADHLDRLTPAAGLLAARGVVVADPAARPAAASPPPPTTPPGEYDDIL